MKYKLLALSVMAAGMVGCANQPIQGGKHAPLNQQVYRSYERLVSKESYAFDAKMTFKLDVAEKPIVDAKDAAIAAEKAEPARQKRLTQLLQQPHGLNATQQQWLKEGMQEELERKSSTDAWALSEPNSASANTLIQAFLERYYFAMDGVVDLKHGQMSFNPKIGYSAKNAQGWMMLPMALDIAASKAYVDVSALSPIITDPQYDGQYVVFDYAELLKKSNLDTKPLLEVMREYVLVNAALTPEKSYERMALTAQDKQIGGAQRIRYIANYGEVMAQYALFFHLNKDYLKTVLPQAEKLAQEMKLTGAQQMFGAEALAEYADVAEAAEEPATAVDRSINRYYEAINGEGATAAATDAMTAAAEAVASDDEDDEYSAYLKKLEAEYAESQLLQEKQDKALEKFAAYQTGKLISAQQMKKIVAEQPEAYADLVASMNKVFEEVELFKDTMFSNELVLDAKGRLIRSEMDIKMGGLAELGMEKMTMTGAINFHSYGSAKVSQSHLKNAVPFSQAANEKTLLNLGKAWEGLTTEKADTANVEVDAAVEKTASQAWSKSERYEKLAESLLAQNKNFLDTYSTVYRYAYLLEGEDAEDEDFDFKQLDNTARWLAIYFADDYGLPLTAKEKAEYDESPDEWYYYDDELSDEVWDAIHGHLQQKKLTQEFQKLSKQRKTDAQIFSALYLLLETEAEQRETGEKEIEFSKQFLKYVKALGEVAIEDIKTEKINMAKFKSMDEDELYWFSPEHYRMVYPFFNPEK